MFKQEEDFLGESVALFLEVCRTGEERVRVALCGGSTPRPVYARFSEELLRNANLDRSCLEFYQVDERYVPSDHPASNQRMIREALIDPLGGSVIHKVTDQAKNSEKTAITGVKFFAFDPSLPIDECVLEYEEVIERIHGKCFDLVVLGIGPDGHVASIFPGSETFDECKHLVSKASTDVFEVRDRLTLTFPAILSSKRVLVLLEGQEKKKTLAMLQDSSVQAHDFPAKRLLEHPNVVIHYCP